MAGRGPSLEVEVYFKLPVAPIPSQTIFACAAVGKLDRFGSELPQEVVVAASPFESVPVPQANQ